MFGLRNSLAIATAYLAICTIQPHGVESANILGLFISQSKSHLVIDFAIARTLIDAGHNLTIVTTIPYKEPNLTGYKHILIPTERSFEQVVSGLISAKGTFNRMRKSVGIIKDVMEIGTNITRADEFQTLMREESFDLLLLGYFFNEYHLGLAEHFNCPAVVIWVQKPFAAIDNLVGNPIFALDHSRVILSLGIQMQDGFWHRLLNFVLAVFDLVFATVYGIFQRSYYEALFPPDKYSSYETALQSVSLLLCNFHFSDGFVRAVVPAFIEIGGIQVKPKPDELPQDLKEFLNNSSQHGTIFLSFGSNVRKEHVSTEAYGKMFRVLSGLKQNVIWKWDDMTKTPGVSKNILYKKWLPQDDILAHPNTRLFITHGGRGSVVETVYHGVPIVGIPMFADQPGNVAEMVSQNFGVDLDIHTLSEDTFRGVINEVINNRSYTEAIQQFSQIYRDRPLPAKENALFWMEYVMRHKGAKHMQSPAVKMNMLQLLGLDVMAFLLVVAYVSWKAIKFVCNWMWKKCCGRKAVVAKESKRE